MKCGICAGQGSLYDVKSFLEMQLHKSKVHGENNSMSQFDSKKAYHAQLGGRKERERNADEKLHEAIDRMKGKVR
jgi:hypothetical protein